LPVQLLRRAQLFRRGRDFCGRFRTESARCNLVLLHEEGPQSVQDTLGSFTR